MAPARLILLNASMPNVMGINAEKKRSSLGIAFTGKQATRKPKKGED